MKVIAINGSPHENGTVHTGLAAMTEELVKEGIEVELVHVGGKNIRGCMACGQCRTLGRCVFNDDPVNACAARINEADGIVLGSPVYYGGIAGTFKSFLDRLFFPGVNLKYKAAATVVSLRRSGGIATFHQLNNYLNLAQAIIAPSPYWDVIHGNNAEEVLQDAEGLSIMRITGQNMAWLMKTIAAGKKEVPLPQPAPRAWTNFIH
ncbi:FMN reductase [Spirochaetia bacterium]|nr:FMN reductase [Spirochaetia bacterium]